LTLFTQFAAVAKSLAHAHRLEILEQLAQGERSVEVIAQRTDLSVANTSQHLQQMRRAGIVAARREGMRPCSISCRRCAGSPSGTSPKWSA